MSKLNLSEYKKTDEYKNKVGDLPFLGDIVSLLNRTVEEPFSILLIDNEDINTFDKFENCHIYRGEYCSIVVIYEGHYRLTPNDLYAQAGLDEQPDWSGGHCTGGDC